MHHKEREEAIGKLNGLIKDVGIAMLTTIDGDVLRSRPMQTQQFDFDGDLWFFTSSATHKAEEIQRENRVNVSYAEPETNTYVSVSGRASIVNDKEKIEELWKPIYEAWFPDGLDDPNLCLLKVSVEQAEYWEASSNAFVQLVGFIRAFVTGQRANGGDHGTVTL